MRARRGIVRGALVFVIVLMASVGSAAIALAHQPGPTGTTQDNWVFLNLTGYKSPPASYTTGDTFSFKFDVSNEANTSRDLCLTLEVYKLNLNPATDYTEAQLENMVATSDTGQTLVPGATMTLTKTFAAHQLITGLTMSATITMAGYYQFDTGLCGTGPFAPRPGFNGPPVSGFVRYLPPPSTSPSGSVSGSTTTPTSPTSNTSAAHLANTGGGAPAPSSSGLLALAGLALVATGLAVGRRVKRRA